LGLVIEMNSEFDPALAQNPIKLMSFTHGRGALPATRQQAVKAIQEGQDVHAVAAAYGDSPQQYRFAFGLWALSLIATPIEREFGKKLSLASVSRITKLLGFSAQKPLYQAWQQDATLVHMWETDTYPAIRAEAKAKGAVDTEVFCEFLKRLLIGAELLHLSDRCS